MKKIIALLLAMVMVLGLAACGTTPAPETTAPAAEGTEATTATEAVVEPVTIKVAAIETAYGSQVWADVAAAFSAETGINVELITDKNLEDVLSGPMQNGEFPDVVHLALGRPAGLTEQLVKANALYDLTNMLATTIPGESTTPAEKIIPGFTATSATNPYAEFFKLCETNTTIVTKCGLVDEKKLSTTEQKSALKKYQIFVDMNGLDNNIQFFNNYRYTAFIPNNEAVQEAIANGLPTWEEIEADYNEMEPVVNTLDSLKDVMDNTDYVFVEEDSIMCDQLWEKAHADSIKLQAKITYLTNFIRYHFADNSIFADKSARAESEMVTSSYDKELGLFCKLYVDRPGNDVLRVRDAYSNTMMETVGEKNVLARDIECSLKPVGRPMATSGKKITLDASSA